MPLTKEANTQIDRTCTELRNRGILPDVIRHSNVLQVVETAARVAAFFSVPRIESPLLHPLYFGVVDGLSTEEIRAA